MDSGLADAFDERLSVLESELFRLRSDLRAARETATDANVAHAPAPNAVEPPRTAAVPTLAAPPVVKQRAETSLESLIAGRGLQLTGLLLVLLGTAFFLELAFTRGWIGPPERILLGLIGGSAIIAGSAQRLRGPWRYLAEGLVGLGGGILYLSIWASVALFPELHVARGAAFGAMIAVTAVLAALAAAYRSERVAILGLLGGLLTPFLLAGGPVDRPLLAVYLLVLIVGMLALSARCAFRAVDVLAFVGALFFVPEFYPEGSWTAFDAHVCASLFFSIFAVAFSLPRTDGARALQGRALLIALDAGVYALMIEGIFAAKPLSTGVALLGLAAFLIAAARIAPVPALLRLTYAFSGLAALTLAMPAIVHATTLLDVFFIEALVVVILAVRAQNKALTLAGAAIYGCTAAALLVRAVTDPPGFAAGGSLALSFAIGVMALVVVRRLPRPSPSMVDLAAWDAALTIVLTLLILGGLTRLCLDLLGGPNWNVVLPSSAEFALSALWTLAATVLFAVGMRFASTLVRWEGLILFGVTILKVFFVDLSSLQAEYRVGSFVGLGIVLVAVSSWYTRAALKRKTEADG
jgi:uncharacterized membrane protein